MPQPAVVPEQHSRVRVGRCARLTVSRAGAAAIAALTTAGCVAGTDPPPECGAPATPIHAVQGAGASSPLENTNVAIEGTVTGVFSGNAPGSLDGFFLQEESAQQDRTTATSEGLFVYTGRDPVTLRRGRRARVTGTVKEFNGLTEISPVATMRDCGAAAADAIHPTILELPFAAASDRESLEGMWVRLPQSLVINDTYHALRHGELILSSRRLWQPTQVVEPGAAARRLRARNQRDSLVLDDGRNGNYRRPFIAGRDNASPLAATNPIRNGYRLEPFEGIFHYAFGAYRVHPLQRPALKPSANPRAQPPPRRAGTTRVVALNLNAYFATLDNGAGGCGPNRERCRGADTPREFQRQTAKLVAALAAMDADILALSELENDGGTSGARLANALNAELDGAPWNAIETGVLDSDVIKPGLLYRSDRVETRGHFAVLDGQTDSAFSTDLHRPALAQSFEDPHGRAFTVATAHLKSKGGCPEETASERDRGDGQGCWNSARTSAAAALVRWLRSNPTGQQVAGTLLVGDLNAYAREEPLQRLRQAGFRDLLHGSDGGQEYTYVYRGRAGSLDHALVDAGFAPARARVWHINADELAALDYNTEPLDGQIDKPERLYRAEPFRSSDHDPVIVDLELQSEASADAGG